MNSQSEAYWTHDTCKTFRKQKQVGLFFFFFFYLNKPRGLNSVMHTVSVDILVKLPCLFVFATYSSLACNTVEMSSRLSQCYTPAMLSLFFQKIGWEKSKVVPIKLLASIKVWVLLYKLSLLCRRGHTHSISFCMRTVAAAGGNDCFAVPSFPWLIKSLKSLFGIEQPFIHLFTAHLRSDTFLGLPQAPGVSRHSFLWYN